MKFNSINLAVENEKMGKTFPDLIELLIVTG